jgi:hypothetical protein
MVRTGFVGNFEDRQLPETAGAPDRGENFEVLRHLVWLSLAFKEACSHTRGKKLSDSAANSSGTAPAFQRAAGSRVPVRAHQVYTAVIRASARAHFSTSSREPFQGPTFH